MKRGGGTGKSAFVFTYNSIREKDMVMRWLYDHEKEIEPGLRATGFGVYTFLSEQDPIIMGIESMQRLSDSKNYLKSQYLKSATLAIPLFALRGINHHGTITAAIIELLCGFSKPLYVIRTITDNAFRGKGYAKTIKIKLLEEAKDKGYGSVWGHHEYGSIMQRINLRLGAEEIMTEPKGWNGSDKTHILYRITL